MMGNDALRVMVVDDEQLARLRMKILLSQSDCPNEVVAEAGDARQALAVFSPTDGAAAPLGDGYSIAFAARGDIAELVALYEKIRARENGVGAAALHQRRCPGCRLELTASDVSRLRDAAPDEVLRCEQCQRILVRTPESGL